MASEVKTGDQRGFSLSQLPLTERHVGFLSILPVILLYLVISIIPVGYAVYTSLHEVSLAAQTWPFVGLDNYVEVFQIDRFWDSLIRGVVFMVGSTILQLIVGLWMAMTLNRINRAQRLITAVVFTSYLIPTIVVTLLATFMLSPSFGVIQDIGANWLGLWSANDAPLGQRSLAMPLLILIGTWKFSVFITIFTLAQLRSIPSRFYEAARVCGANKWEMFRDVTLPRIQGVILVAVLLRSIFMFNKFDLIWTLTQGGPGSATTTLPVLAYIEGFQNFNLGLANALAVVMFVFLAIGGIAYFKAFNPSSEVET
ncbi:ABC transporter permease subunit [Halosegnis rubeus]|jgi:multiple sugar transport system permease protein|uniref:ABC transporter permease subunit n=1 Tax=Halosegnis rubeus TaxID=2212850 RepID=A0A5N5U691_9EURY|nr:sugar ABC transporter permease [Halosegnis rubeus]KAB7512504.1 ABC transporter permease subunit [Halosegnis rubeus]KAB7512598.1 ABC transporter permease subunit [Halosegnis rubeus]KAB7514068.1 ABC transporter permease subunit [Halosegnis rubeus]